MKIVVLSSNIEAGKSTLLREIRRLGVGKVVLGDVDLLKNCGSTGVSLPVEFYSGKIDAFTYHVTILSTFIEKYVNAVKASEKNADSILILERSIFDVVHVFGERMFKSGRLSVIQFDLLKYLCKCFASAMDMKIDASVLLLVDYRECFERCMNRGRPEELGLNLGYFRNLHNSYCNAFLSKKLSGKKRIVINGTGVGPDGVLFKMLRVLKEL